MIAQSHARKEHLGPLQEAAGERRAAVQVDMVVVKDVVGEPLIKVGQHVAALQAARVYDFPSAPRVKHASYLLEVSHILH